MKYIEAIKYAATVADSIERERKQERINQILGAYGLGTGLTTAGSIAYVGAGMPTLARLTNDDDAVKNLLDIKRKLLPKTKVTLPDVGSDFENLIAGPRYNPMSDTIVRGSGHIGRSPGILAHEMGHALGSKKLLYGNIAGKQLVGLGTLGALLGNEEISGGSAALGTAAALPLLASEFDASRRGFSLLGQAGVKGLRRLTPFLGMPTYLAAAAVPALTYKAKQYLGGFEDDWRDKLLRLLNR